jgi:radical SAM superfamily enzyme YgiQ (UPF0313 family)
MRVTLVKPNIGHTDQGAYRDTGCMEPLNLGVLAALTPPDVEVTLVDDRLEQVPFDAPADLVGITVETFTARRAYEIADEYRRRGVPVVLGGVHPFLAPAEALAHADSLCLGDAETCWAGILADARRRGLEPLYRAPSGRPQPGAPTRRDLYSGKSYLPITLLQFGRGCPFDCSFCAVARYFGRRHHCRDVAEVIGEIESQDRRLVFFVDDNINACPKRAMALYRALKPLKVRWVSQSTIDMADNPALMEAMLESGCLGHVVGFESIDPRNLGQMRKAPNLRRWERYARQIRVMREAGLQTWAAFVLGYDFETPESVAETAQFAIEQKFAFAAFNLLMPYPGTRTYRELEAQGRLLYGGRWWLDPDYRFDSAAFRPARCSPEELTEACWQARRRFNGLASVLNRAFDLKTHLRSPARFAAYLMCNTVSRREVFKKHGMRFGLDAPACNSPAAPPESAA